jgi:hypothetical protein
MIGGVIAQGFIRQPVTPDILFRFQASLCEIHGWQSGSATCFSPSSLVSPCHCHSTYASCFSHPPTTVCYRSKWHFFLTEGVLTVELQGHVLIPMTVCEWPASRSGWFTANGLLDTNVRGLRPRRDPVERKQNAGIVQSVACYTDWAFPSPHIIQDDSYVGAALPCTKIRLKSLS